MLYKTKIIAAAVMLSFTTHADGMPQESTAASLPSGTPLLSIGTMDDWILVSWDGQTCFLQKQAAYGTTDTATLILSFDPSVPDARREKLQASIDALPQGIVRLCASEGWQVTMPPWDLACTLYPDLYGPNTVLGFTSYDEKTIYLDNRDKAVAERNVLHELGHALDCIEGLPSHKTDWKNLCIAERDSFVCTGETDGHSRTNPEEYFAACLVEYCMHPDSFLSSAPMSYAWMDQFVKGLSLE